MAIQMIQSFEGFLEFESHEDKVVNSKGLMRRFFKNNSQSFQNALENPERKTLIQAEFEQRKAKILADINKKCFKKAIQNSSKKSEVASSKTDG
jgi:hypothetical protein